MAFRMIEDETPESSINADLVHRIPAQATARVASELVGLPGNILSAANEYIAGPLSKAITGKPAIPYEQTLIGKALPTSETFQRGLERDIPYLKPKNKIEKFTTDTIGDAASLFAPGKVFKAGKYAMTPLRSLGASIGGNALGSATTEFTGDERAGAKVKAGTLLGLSLFNKPKAASIANEQYARANKLLPKNATQNASKLENGLNNLKSDVLKGRSTQDLSPSEKFVIDEVDKILRQIDYGEANIETLVASKRSLNEMLNKFIFESPDKTAKAGARRLANRINGQLRETFEDYGKTNPEWWKAQKGADEAFGAIAQSNYISRLLQNIVKGRPSGLAHIFGLGAEIGAAALSGPAAIGGLAAYQGAKLASRVMNSPVLRKHYAKVINAAATENTKLLNSEMDRFQEEIVKQEKNESGKYRLLD